MKTRMVRCLECKATIRKTAQYHQQIRSTRITGLMREVVYTPDYLEGVWCCECLGHDWGECKEMIERERFGKAIIRSIATQTGYVRSGTHEGYLNE